MSRLSVVVAARNEEENISGCLASVKAIADEIIVVDEESNDNTREIAKKFGAKVIKVKHAAIFHKSKQRGLDEATGEWILQLDADERVTPQLAREIRKIICLTTKEIKKRGTKELFKRHQRGIEKRDGTIGIQTGETVGFFIPRKNFFLGKPLIHAGVYPDGVIRLVKKGKARFPSKSVHEQIVLDGEVAWLSHDLEHHDSPTLSRYFARFNRYTDLKAEELKKQRTPKNIWNFLKFTFLLPTFYFLLLYIRHKGFFDGMRGFLWSLFSSWHYPISYFKYYNKSE